MVQSIPDQTKAAIGAPSSVRVGTVASLNPLVITVQGVPFQTVGTLKSYVPQVGDAVALLGQSPTSGSDPTSWLAMGGLSVNGQQHFIASLTSSINLVVASTVLGGTAITFTTTNASTLVQAWYSADLESVGGTLTQATVRPFVDGAALPSQTLIVYDMPVINDGRFTLGQQTFFTVGPGTHTIDLRSSAGVANQIRASAASTSIMITVHG
jgi:hypothetical protein